MAGRENGRADHEVEDRSFRPKRFKPVPTGTRTIGPVVAGLNALGEDLGDHSEEVSATLKDITDALRLNKKGTPIGLLSTWQAGWRGVTVLVTSGITVVAFYRGLHEAWPYIAQFVSNINQLILKGT